MLAKLYYLSCTSSPFCSGYVGHSFSNYLPGLASNCDLPISASQVARIIGVSHQHLAPGTLTLKKITWYTGPKSVNAHLLLAGEIIDFA
jgi:hypothetical protein